MSSPGPGGAKPHGPGLVLFGTGSPLARAALSTLAARFPVTAVVVPEVGAGGGVRRRLRAAARWLATRRFVQEAQSRGIAVWAYRRGATGLLEARLAAARPSLICVASFPYVLPRSVLDCPEYGALNVHPSLLPRHRGPAPLFWTYHDDDREAGVTVHWMEEAVDAGPVVFQEAVPLARGRPIEDLYEELGRRGTALLARAVDEIGRGSAPRIVQDEARATREPLPALGAWRIDYATWGAERLWHFLAGLGRHHPALLHDADGAEFTHGPALRFTVCAHGRRPGGIEPAGGGWRVYCRDGVVEVAGPGGTTRLLALARRLDRRQAGDGSRAARR